MKTLIAVSVLALANFTVSARPVTDGNTVTITGNQQSIVVPGTPRAMSEQDFGKYVGSYELSNGDSISLFTRAGVKCAALHGQVAHALVAKDSHTFVARDGQLEVTIDKHDDGTVGGEVLMMVSDDKVAGGATQQHVVSVAFH